jgi:hypothetical protein
MEIIIEDAKVEMSLPRDNVSLKELIDEVEGFLFNVGKIPVALTINGSELTQKELEHRENEELSGKEKIEFGVITVLEFLNQNLEGASLANQELKKHISTFAKEIYETNKTVTGDELVKEMNNFFDFWLRLSSLLPDDFTAMKFSGKAFNEVFDNLRATFTEIVEAMEDNDFVLASDLLQYEVLTAVEDIDSGIPRLRELVKERSMKDEVNEPVNNS